MDDLIKTLRSLYRARGYSVAAALTLMFGLGASAVIASAVWAVLLRPLPFAEPAGLVWVGHAHAERGVVGAFSPQDYDDLAAATIGPRGAFASLADYSWTAGNTGVNLTGAGEPLRVPVASVSGSFFTTLGIAAAIGRPLLPADDRPGANHVVVLSDRLWHARFGGSAAVLGQVVTLDGEPYTVIGVMPAAMAFPAREVDLWSPLSLVGENLVPHQRGVRWLEVIGRLGPGVTARAATAQATAVLTRLEQEFPGDDKGFGRAALQPLRERIVGDVRPLLAVLAGAVGMVLLVLCVNLANLGLARAVGRRRELAVRAALGATPLGLMRQILSESVLLALIGGGLGLLLARLVTGRFASLAAGYLPRTEEIRLDATVALFTLGLSVACGLAFGLAAARRAAGPRLREALQQGGATAQGGRTGVGRTLVAVETALATVLLIGAGLLVRSFWVLSHVAPGFEPDHVLSLSITLPANVMLGTDGGAAYRDEILRRLRAVPGVQAVAASHNQPLEAGETHSIERVGSDDLKPISPAGGLLMVSSDYFATLGIPVRSGREFDARDDEGRGAPAVMVSESLARQLWPGDDAVGKRVRLDGQVSSIVGVVGDVHSKGLAEPGMPTVYGSMRSFSRSTAKLFVRTSGNPLAAIAAVRRTIWQLHPSLPISEVAPLGALVSADVARPQLLSLLTSGFGAVAALLAAFGIYGVTAQGVRWRTQEIGVRMALGADRGRLYRLVIGEAMRLAVAGLVVGLLAGMGVARALGALLFGVTPGDVPTYLAVAFVVALAALLASYLPAREASELDPLAALKSS